MSSPAESFTWPAEWAPHQATWIAWPHNPDTWPGRLERVPVIFERKIKILAEVEQVNVLAGQGAVYDQAFAAVGHVPNVVVHDFATNDCWIRDYGPTWVRNTKTGEITGVDWKFNAWGGKYAPYNNDAAAAKWICGVSKTAYLPSKLYCEGGALETDGEGTLLTTSSCLLCKDRNPDSSRAEIEAEMKEKLGVRQIVWVDGGGLEGDDTDGHIDQMARFVAPGMVVAAVSTLSHDCNAAGLEENIRILKQSSDAAGRTLDVIRLPTPPPRWINGQRVPESYCNFYIANEIVLLPTFGYRPTDEAAEAILKDLFPNRQVISLLAADLAWGLGAFHCATQQQPAQ